jgi:hypothetical protein
MITAKPQASISHTRQHRRRQPPHRHHTLRDVDDQHQESEQLALCAHGIGRTGIAASHAADIHAAQPPQDQAAE